MHRTPEDDLAISSGSSRNPGSIVYGRKLPGSSARPANCHVLANIRSFDSSNHVASV
jgi:hypothetical protein